MAIRDKDEVRKKLAYPSGSGPIPSAVGATTPGAIPNMAIYEGPPLPGVNPEAEKLNAEKQLSQTTEASPKPPGELVPEANKEDD